MYARLKSNFTNRETYISDHVLLNLLNELGKRDKILMLHDHALFKRLNALRKIDKMPSLLSILSLFLKKFNTVNKIRAQMLHLYHMVLKCFF